MTSDREPWSPLISIDRVIELWQEGMRRFGAREVPQFMLDELRACVHGRLGNAWSAMLYREPEEATRGLFLAAQLFFYLANDHCFSDGNKRVSWLAAMEIFRHLRLTVAATNEEAEELAMGVADGTITSVDEVALWLAPRLEWVSKSPTSTD